MTFRRIARAAAAAWLLAASAFAAAAVPVPAVTGPIPGDPPGSASRNYPFFATDLDLKSRGYVEEEFFYAGTANRYDATVAGGIGARPTASPTANVVSGGHAYKTRMVVRRPADPSRFNGIVVVEWMNATSNYDVEALWFRAHEFFLREGYAWIGITAQSGPITNATLGLRQFSPTRYGTLDLTAGGTLTSGDPLSYDVYAQGLQAVRQANVLGPLKPALKKVIAAGVSQSAGRLSVYANAVHPREPAVMDALLLYIGGEKIRTDLGLPVIKLLSETEYTAPASANEISVLQPDTERIRIWSMAGTSHSDWASFAVRYALLRRDQPTAGLRDTCDAPSRSRIPDRYVISASIDWLKRWATDPAVVPPTSPAIALSGTTVQRDADGNALGGIRLAPFAVPVAVDTGANTGAALCFLNGTHVPFSAARLNALYPTRDAYLRPFEEAARKNVADGFVLQADADEMVRLARVSINGFGLDCGPLCANAAQFPIQPSTQLLRDHTQFLYMRNGDALLQSLDAATLTVARGYTAPADQKAYQFSQGAKWLQRYKGQVDEQLAAGNATPQQAALLQEYADTLVTELQKQGATPETVTLDASVLAALYPDDSSGCSMVRGTAKFDPLLLGLVVLALFALVRRRA